MNKVKFTRDLIRVVMLSIMAVAVIATTIDGFAQSYAGLYRWGLQHGLHGWKAESFPLLVDAFILIGEIGLFLMALDGHKIRLKEPMTYVDFVLPFTTAAAGWGVSLWFNIARIGDADFATKATYGIPPVTAMVGLLILLRTVHRYTERFEAQNSARNTIPGELIRQPESPEPVPAAQTAGALPAGEPVPSAGEPENAPESGAERPDEPVPAKPAAVAMLRPEPPMPVAESTAMLAQTTAVEHDPLIAKMMRHAKWPEAVKLYRESIETPGKSLSQRDLAAELGMKNRTLAKAAIDFVNREKEMSA